MVPTNRSRILLISSMEPFRDSYRISIRGRDMGSKRTGLLRGTLDLLILKALALEPLHGVGIPGVLHKSLVEPSK